ncbi:MAG: hypothetical protein IPI35_01810 [Deltaproteobacteria bacterium]|nr:hypothetical protein [Deltaproteobacteria bacterium]
MSEQSGELCWLVDASVLINLLCMPCPEKVLAALQAPVVATPMVLGETRRVEAAATAPRSSGPAAFLSEVRLTEEELERFGALVSASPPDALDDGEASVLAVAASRGWPCLIDERKATRLAAAQRPPVVTLSTVRAPYATPGCVSARALRLGRRAHRRGVPRDVPFAQAKTVNMFTKRIQ